MWLSFCCRFHSQTLIVHTPERKHRCHTQKLGVYTMVWCCSLWPPFPLQTQIYLQCRMHNHTKHNNILNFHLWWLRYTKYGSCVQSRVTFLEDFLKDFLFLTIVVSLEILQSYWLTCIDKSHMNHGKAVIVLFHLSGFRGGLFLVSDYL